MAKRIFKYELDAAVCQRIMMPKGATILSVQWQHGVLCMWASVDPESPPELRHFVLAGTGDLTPDGPFLQTLQANGGGIVLHLFEVSP